MPRVHSSSRRDDSFVKWLAVSVAGDTNAGVKASYLHGSYSNVPWTAELEQNDPKDLTSLRSYLYSLQIKLAVFEGKTQWHLPPPPPFAITVTRGCKWCGCFCSRAWAFGDEVDSPTVNVLWPHETCADNYCMRSALSTSLSKTMVRKAKSLEERKAIVIFLFYFIFSAIDFLKVWFCGNIVND